MKMTISFSGTAGVDVHTKNFTILTDQPEHAGGSGSAPAPFDFFLASIGSCAGFYVRRFLEQRNLPIDEVSLVLETEKNPGTKMIERITFDIRLPAEFPPKYKTAVARAVDQCSVKRHLYAPPTFETRVAIASNAALLET